MQLEKFSEVSSEPTSISGCLNELMLGQLQTSDDGEIDILIAHH